jgi:hypothetical protein
MEPDRRELVGRQENRERPLGRRVEQPREVDDVPAVRQEHAGVTLVLQVVLQQLRAPLVPVEREPVVRGRREAVILFQEERRGFRPIHARLGPGRRSEKRARRGGSGRGEKRAPADLHFCLQSRKRANRIGSAESLDVDPSR